MSAQPKTLEPTTGDYWRATRHEARADLLEAELAEALAMLNKLEWGGTEIGSFVGYSGPVCPVCRASPRDGHSRKGCALAEILKKHKP